MTNVTKRITVNLPADLLEQAMQVTGKGIEETLTEGLRRIRRGRLYEKAMALKGKIHLDIDRKESRLRRGGDVSVREAPANLRGAFEQLAGLSEDFFPKGRRQPPAGKRERL